MLYNIYLSKSVGIPSTGISVQSPIRIRPAVMGDMAADTHTHTHSHTECHSNSLAKSLGGSTKNDKSLNYGMDINLGEVDI